jgi:flavin reductase (DIM6/NTAB) family NADH-FMN oxidoreductase RutF
MTQITHSDKDTPEEFRATMRRFAASVCVVTANDGHRDHGMTVTAVTSVSMEPPSLLVCLNNRTQVHEMLLNQPWFAINVLGAQQAEISAAFSGAVAPEDRFDDALWVRDKSGMMVLKENHAVLICHRKVAIPYGTHTIFVGDVKGASVSDDTESLLYADASYCVSQSPIPINGDIPSSVVARTVAAEERPTC